MGSNLTRSMWPRTKLSRTALSKRWQHKWICWGLSSSKLWINHGSHREQFSAVKVIIALPSFLVSKKDKLQNSVGRSKLDPQRLFHPNIKSLEAFRPIFAIIHQLHVKVPNKFRKNDSHFRVSKTVISESVPYPYTLTTQLTFSQCNSVVLHGKAVVHSSYRS